MLIKLMSVCMGAWLCARLIVFLDMAYVASLALCCQILFFLNKICLNQINPIFFMYPTLYQMGEQGNSGLYLVLCINSMSLKCSMIVTLWFWVLITIYLGVIRVQTIEMTSLSALLPPNKMADCCVLWPTKSDRFPTGDIPPAIGDA